MSINTIQAVNEPHLGDKPGLKLDIVNAKGPQKADCPSCHTSGVFEPEKLYWQAADDTFEITEAKCSGCNAEFELTAAQDGRSYDYFGE